MGTCSSVNSQKQPAWFIFSSDGPWKKKRKKDFFFQTWKHGNMIFFLSSVNNPPNTGGGKSLYQKGMVTKISASSCCRGVTAPLNSSFVHTIHCQVSQSSSTLVLLLDSKCQSSLPFARRQCCKQKNARCWHSWGAGVAEETLFPDRAMELEALDQMLLLQESDAAWRNTFLEGGVFSHLLVHFIRCSGLTQTDTVAWQYYRGKMGMMFWPRTVTSGSEETQKLHSQMAQNE